MTQTTPTSTNGGTPLIIIGLLGIVGGFFFPISVDVPYSSLTGMTEVANLSAMHYAQLVMLAGCAFFVAGCVVNVGSKLDTIARLTASGAVAPTVTPTRVVEGSTETNPPLPFAGTAPTTTKEDGLPWVLFGIVGFIVALLIVAAIWSRSSVSNTTAAEAAADANAAAADANAAALDSGDSLDEIRARAMADANAAAIDAEAAAREAIAAGN